MITSRSSSQAQLSLPDALYGRDAAYERLMAAWHEARGGKRALALVCGYSGIGKTAIVRQLREQIGGEAVFVGGKYDQVQRSTPYMAIAEALTEFAQYLASLPSALFETRCATIREAMGGLARVIADLAPALARALGNPPPVPVLSGIEARHRCAAAFGRLIHAVSDPAQPLCLFLDDLQWADGASVELLRAVLCDEAQMSRGGLLVIGTYRENEVDASHPFARVVADAEAVGLPIRRIALSGLSRSDVRSLLVDTLHDGTEAQRSRLLTLADTLHGKTAGNPFFLRMLLSHLHATRVLSCEHGRWEWQEEAVVHLGVADNVAELMSARLHRLAASVRDTLATGAMLGRSFSLTLLAEAAGMDAAELVERQQGPLTIAQREGLIDVRGGPDGPVTFVHDRIQQAALSLIPADQQAGMRLTVGRRLLRGRDPESLGDQLFIVAALFEAGAPLDDPSERLQIAQLHLCAGRRARAGAAFSVACEFLEAGIALLPDDAWKQHPALALALHRDAMLSAVTDARHERAAELFDILLAHVDDPVELAECASFRTMQLAILGQYQEALQLGLEFFGRLGFPIDLDRIDSEIDGLLDEAHHFLQAPGALEAIADHPMASDPRLVSAVKLGIFLTPTAFFVDMRVHDLIVLRGFSWALRHGPCAATPAYMVRLNLIFITNRQDYSLADRVGKAAIAAARRFGDPQWLGDALFIHALFGSHWKRPLREALPFGEEGLARLRETGDLQMSRFYITLPLAIECGDSLELALAEADAGIADACRNRKRHLELLFMPQRQFVLALRGDTQGPCSFTDSAYTDERLWDEVASYPMARTYYAVCRLQLAVMAGRWEEAVKFAAEAQSTLWSVTGFLATATHRLHAGIARCAVAASTTGVERESLLAQAADDLAQMQAWARLNAHDFEHRAMLMEAQWHRAHGESARAIKRLEQAAVLSRAAGFTQDEALAHELIGRHHAACGATGLAAHSLAAARDAFARWGATVHVRRLDAEISRLAAEVP
ncbi:ATP-binding protein [Lysobacter yangpyeongensis]|uniref:ATP-binding protein n=1 Tax=Lysobacter yangpyeongensis TaxID=346182 RepID=A0ABW0SK42_9GAMM